MLVTGIEGATVGATVITTVDVVWGADVTVGATVVVVVVVSTTVDVVVEVVGGSVVAGTVVSGTVVVVVVVVVVDVVVSGHVVVVSGVVVGGSLCNPVYDKSYCTFHPHSVPPHPLGFPQQTAARNR